MSFELHNFTQKGRIKGSCGIEIELWFCSKEVPGSNPEIETDLIQILYYNDIGLLRYKSVVDRYII